MEKIEVHDLQFQIGDKKILNQVNIKIPKGKMIGIIGPNGSGKTTTLKHIYRAIEPKKKCVYIDGNEVHSLSYKESAKKMTVMKQENSSDFEYTIYEMVMMGRIPHRNLFEKDSAKDKELVENALRYVGMYEQKDRYYTELSGGEKQRVMIARSLAQETEIFILDEPTNHLDVHYQWAIMDIIRSLDKTIVAVFHELNLAAIYCDELYVMKDGKIIVHGIPEEILTKQLLADVFAIDADIINHNQKSYIIYNNAITV